MPLLLSSFSFLLVFFFFTYMCPPNFFFFFFFEFLSFVDSFCGVINSFIKNSFTEWEKRCRSYGRSEKKCCVCSCTR